MAVKIDDAEITKVRLEEQSSNPSTPASGYSYLYERNNGYLYLIDDAGTVRVFRDQSGWIPDLNTWTFLRADAPSYEVSIDAGITGSISVGMKAQLTHGGSLKNFIVTNVAITGSTSYLNLYGGTDYTLSAGAITSPKYSPEKTPFGFPTSPIKWSVSISDVTSRTQASPTQNTWYNLGSLSINIPLGVWYVTYQVVARADLASSPRVQTTLSTANNSESDTEFTTFNGAGATVVINQVTRAKVLALTAKATYYLNTRTTQASVTQIQNPNDQAPALMSAVCAYL